MSFANNMARQQILYSSHSHKPISKRPQAVQLLLHRPLQFQIQSHSHSFILRHTQDVHGLLHQLEGRKLIDNFRGSEEPVQEASARHTVEIEATVCRRRITRGQSERLRVIAESNGWKMFQEYSREEVNRIFAEIGITRTIMIV
ncbi:hypothetical protein Salat_0167000 [Sesamum alatum]|uniref:Uncharacterized protein n=1 Tax=Sesamum alatum TaxID=300844 RepID=A0AAE1YXZ2_9LAMI|nr:hypothetical protein Salat_0167000 [Sesamum alatum]